MEGVLATTAPAYFDGGSSLYSLTRMLDRHFEREGVAAKFAFEVDLVLTETRVLKPDAVLMTESDLRKQKAVQAKRRRRRNVAYGRLRVPPTLVIESVSLDHEPHDRQVKRAWYAEAGVPHYWMLDAYHRPLECLLLHEGAYRLDQSGRRRAVLRPAAFPGLVIPLAELWG